MNNYHFTHDMGTIVITDTSYDLARMTLADLVRRPTEWGLDHVEVLE